MNNEMPTLEQTANVVKPALPHGSFSVLIVDDETTLATMLFEVLKSAGYTCSSSNSPLEVLQRSDISAIDLVVTDIRMPGMNGVEFAEALHSKGAKARVIFMTGQADLETISQAMTLQPFGYLRKPFGISEFRELVGQAFKEYCEESTREQKLVNLTDEVQELEKDIAFRTDRLIAEQTLMQGLIGNATFGLIAVDDRLSTYLLNDMAASLLQLKPQPSSANFGVPLISLLPPECAQDVIGLCSGVVTSGKLMETTFRNSLNDRLLSLVSYPIMHRETVSAAVIVIHDVTEKDTLQKRLLQSAKLASIGELAAGIAHEINNPLGFVTSNCNTLTGHVDTLMKYLQTLESTLEQQVLPETTRTELTKHKATLDIAYIVEDLKPLVAETLDGLARVSKIVRDLKTFARAESDSPQLGQVNTLIDDSINLVRNETKNKLEIQKEFSELPEILCFPTQLVQVFTNMFVNAAQAVTNQGTLKIRTASETDHIRVTIQDDGGGIPEKHLARIFDPFFTTKPPGKGTGMGLSISFGILQRHGGSITVQSELGKGTEFVITLPKTGAPSELPIAQNETAGGV